MSPPARPSSRRERGAGPVSSARFGAASFLLVLLTGLGCALRPPPRGTGVDARIQYVEGILARYPRHYPAQADLALAFLDKTRQTLDPVWLNKARAAAQRSLDIQANHEAFKVLAAIEAFAHRFDDSIRWAYLARTTLPDDPEVTSRIVESLLGLGRKAEARRLLVADGTAVKDFHTTAALALLEREEGQPERAAAAFERAALLAAAQRSSELAVWAHAMAAGVWLDAGDLASSGHALSLAAAITAESALAAATATHDSTGRADPRPGQCLSTRFRRLTPLHGPF